MYPKQSITLFLVVGLILIFTIPALAEDEQPWSLDFGIRNIGGDININYHDFQLIDGLDTTLTLALGYGKEESYYYRNSDNSIYNAPKKNNLASYEGTNTLWGIGIHQGLIYDKENERNLLEMIALYTENKVKNSKSDSIDGALIFESGLPDAYKITQKSFIVGISYNNVIENDTYFTKKGFKSELLFEVAPKSLNDIADFSRSQFNFVGFLPIIENETYSIYFGNQFVVDKLKGDYVPINSRKSFATTDFLPLAGLDGPIRSINAGKYDGYVKFVNNFDIRVNFPHLFNEKLTPGIIIYNDFGYTSGLENKIDSKSKSYHSSGLGLTLYEEYSPFKFNIIVYYSKPCDDSATMTLTLGTHF